MLQAVLPSTQDGDGACPHLAALLKSKEELPAVLASFYGLGAARNGWLWFGSLPGEAELNRRRLRGAGLDVDGLEAEGRLAIVELDLSVQPEAFVDPWVDRLDEALRLGYDALWFARFPIEPGAPAVAGVLPFERAWMDRFRARRVVTLCPYIVGGLEPAAIVARAGEVGTAHHRVLRLDADRLVPVSEGVQG